MRHNGAGGWGAVTAVVSPKQLMNELIIDVCVIQTLGPLRRGSIEFGIIYLYLFHQKHGSDRTEQIE